MNRIVLSKVRFFFATIVCTFSHLSLVVVCTLVLSTLILSTPLLAQASSIERDNSEQAFPTENQETAEAVSGDTVSSHTVSSHTVSSHTVSAADALEVGTPDVVGQWSDVQEWPVIAIHASLMPNGKVLAWDAVVDDFDSDPHNNGSNSTRATIWDPVADTHLSVNPNTESDLFCAGHALLPDGRLFAAGGDIDASNAIDKSNIFDPIDNRWTRTANMSYPRWYPSVTLLANGEMLVTAGGPSTHEVWTTGGTYRTLTGAVRELPDYPWLQVAANGKVFMAGPNPPMAYLDTTGEGSWEDVGRRDDEWRDYGAHAMYDVDKILVTGGGLSSETAVIVDPNTAVVTATSSMAIGRRQHNLTVLADGSLLAIGGNDNGAPLVDINAHVMTPELWDPATGLWSAMADMQIGRQYHAIALFLPDGRVLSAGGGYCSDCNTQGYLEQNAEIFSPPYLFKPDGSGQLADRPSVDAAPASVEYGESFLINSLQSPTIEKVSFIRLGSATHSTDSAQRYIPLDFIKYGGQIRVFTPDSANVAPPGSYMLVIVDEQGVPSVARFIQVGTDVISPAPPPPSRNGSVITVRAKGKDGPENMELRINGQLEKSWDMLGTEFADFTYQHTSFLITDTVSVHFNNAAYDPDNGINRALTVDQIRVDDTVYQAEAPTVLVYGLWTGSSCNTAAYYQVETISCNGYFRFTLNNTPPPVNSAPVLINPGPQFSMIGDTVSLAIAGSDPDQDPLAFSAMGLPTGTTIDRDSGIIAGTVSAVGRYEINLAVTDGNGGGDDIAFTWTVNEFQAGVAGDVTCDQVANAIDSMTIMQHVVGLRSTGQGCPLAAPRTQIYPRFGDVSGDGAVNAIDALMILQCQVGIRNDFCRNGLTNQNVRAGAAESTNAKMDNFIYLPISAH